MSITHSPVKTRKEDVLPWSTLTWSYDGDIYPNGQDLIGWTAGNLNFSNDLTYPIESGLEAFVDTKYLYWDVTNSGIFQFGSASDCIGNGIIPIGVGIENLESGQEASLRVFQGPGLNITADNIATNTLSAISANIGDITAGTISGIEIYGSTITGGTIRTSDSTTRIELTGSDNRLQFYESGTLMFQVRAGTTGLWFSFGEVGGTPPNMYGVFSSHFKYFHIYGVTTGDSQGLNIRENITDFDKTTFGKYDDDGVVFSYGEYLVTQINGDGVSGSIGFDFVLVDDALSGIKGGGSGEYNSLGNSVYFFGDSTTSRVGIGDTAVVMAPARTLQISKNDGNPQVRISYSSSVYTDLESNSSGYLNITPTGDILRLWESAKGANDYADFSVDTYGYLSIVPAGNILRLWESAKGTNDYADFFVDVSGNLTIDPGGEYITTPDHIRAAYDENEASYFGKAAVGYCGHDDGATLSHIDSNTQTGYAFMAGSAGETFINAATGQIISFRNNNTTIGDFSSTGFNVQGQYEMDGSAIIDSSGNQTGVLRTRMALAYGFAGVWSSDDTLHGVGGVDFGEHRLAYDATLTAISLSVNLGIVTGVSDLIEVRVQVADGDSDESYATLASLNLDADDNGKYGSGVTGLSNALQAADRIRVSLLITAGNPTLTDPIVTLYFLSK